jgi:electron transfer flavoprotein alpha subunit
MREVWAYSETVQGANETLSAANEIAKSLSGQAVMVQTSTDRPGSASFGKKLVVKTAADPRQFPEAVAEALFRAASDSKPAMILVASTRNGREVAARLAVKRGVGCLPDSYNLSTDGKFLVGERGEYAGKVQTRLAVELPCVALVKVASYAAATGGGGDVTTVDVGEFKTKTSLASMKEKGSAIVDLKAAKIIVSAGRGVKRKEDLRIIESLAKSLGGSMGCSRPLSSDLGWLPEEYHIGLTGVNVKPDLYIAVGISGQLQHVAGIKDSKIIAAINTDKDAPIFQAADYGIVGDLYQVVPALERAIAKSA